MKKVLLTAFAVIAAASVFAQGTVNFNNRVTGTLVNYVYLGGTHQIVGNAATDTPAGTTDWTGFTKITGSGYMAALLGATGASVAEGSLTFGATPVTTTFRTGGAAGNIAGFVATIGSVAPDAATGTFEVFAWDIRNGTDPVAVLAAFRAGTAQFPAGLSGAFNVVNVGGSVNTPPVLTGWQSFNIFVVPEPTTMALAGLGAAAMLIFRRRK